MAKDCGAKCSEHGIIRWVLGILCIIGMGLLGSAATTHYQVSEAREQQADQRLEVERKFAEIRIDIAVAREASENSEEMLKEVRAQLRRQWGKPGEKRE